MPKKDFVSSIKDTKHTLEIVKADLQHKEWPVRIVTNLIEYLISNNIDLENNDLNYPQNNWLDDYRELDPDPTEIWIKLDIWLSKHYSKTRVSVC